MVCAACLHGVSGVLGREKTLPKIAGLNIISLEGNVLQAAKCNSAHHSSVVCHSGMSIDRRGLEILL